MSLQKSVIPINGFVFMGLREEEIDDLEKNNQQWYRDTFKQVFRQCLLKLPDSYRDFLMYRLPDDPNNNKRDFCWYASEERISKETQYFTKLWEEDRKQKKGMWLAIAQWSDKHTYWLCVDKGNVHYGTVRDTHDGHPWDPQRNWIAFPDFNAMYYYWELNFKI